MTSLSYLTLDKDVRQLRATDFDDFGRQISGGVQSAADKGYDEARKVWNATVDRRPDPTSSPAAPVVGLILYTVRATSQDRLRATNTVTARGSTRRSIGPQSTRGRLSSRFLSGV